MAHTINGCLILKQNSDAIHVHVYDKITVAELVNMYAQDMDMETF